VKLVGIMPVRNEAWCLGFTLSVALKWCDAVVCCDHGSTDRSRAIMEELGDKTKRVTIREDRESDWNEMPMRNMLLSEARIAGATHVAIIDADEFLTADRLLTIRSYVENLRLGTMLELPLYNVRGETGVFPWRYHANGVWGNRWVATAFQDSPALHWAGPLSPPRADGLRLESPQAHPTG
jgi:glycosyltransferase involved in cell wall biosynthesis